MPSLNRYSDLTWNRLDLPSLSEQMLVPALQRQKHDKLLAEQELIRSGLAKTDPLQQHFDKALELKRGIESKLDSTATRLAKEGIGPDMTSEAIRLNREYQDLVAPTGDLGKINIAKQIYNTEKDSYIKNAIEQGIGKDQAERNWQNVHAAKYTGFNDKGDIINIGSYGAPTKQDLTSDIKDAHSILGNYKQTLANSGYRLFPDKNTGLLMFADRSGNLTTTTNIPQVNQALKSINEKWLKPEGEGYKWAEHAGLDKQNLTNRIESSFASMIEKGIEDTRKEGYSIAPEYLNKPKTETVTTPQGIADPASVEEINKEARDIDYSSIGSPIKSSSLRTAMETSMGPSGLSDAEKEKLYAKYEKPRTYEDVIKNPIIRGFYKNTYNRLIKAGKLPKGTDINSPKAAAAIGPIIQRSKIPTIGNDVIRPDITPSAEQFSGNLAGKSAKERSSLISQEIRNGFRTIIDPETREEITGDEAREKGYTFSYIGYESPINFRGHNFAGKDTEARREQQVMPHKVEVFKDGKSLGMTEVSRTPNERNSPQYKASYDITQSYRRAVRNMGEWVPVNHTKNANLKGDKVRINMDGTFSVYDKDSKQIYRPMSSGEFADYIYSKTL